MKIYQVVSDVYSDSLKSRLCISKDNIIILLKELLKEYDSSISDVKGVEIDEAFEDFEEIHFIYYDRILEEWSSTKNNKPRCGLKPFYLRVFETID